MAAVADTPALTLHGVGMCFGGLEAVAGITLTVERGERWAVIGPNGAGKTTLFRTISGECIPTSGRVDFFGRDVTRLRPNRRARAGLGRTYQITNVFPALTVRDNVVLAAQATSPARFRSWWPLVSGGLVEELVDRALDQTGLRHRSEDVAGELSHGEQRQLELALGLAGTPSVLLLDEPAAGLSVSERVFMRELIESLPQEVAIVLIEHDMTLALDLVSQVLCMENGKAIARGTPDEIRADERVQAVYLKAE